MCRFEISREKEYGVLILKHARGLMLKHAIHSGHVTCAGLLESPCGPIFNSSGEEQEWKNAVFSLQVLICL